MKQHYIHATLEMLKSGKPAEAVLAGLCATMAKKGHERLLAAVLRGVLRVLETQKTTGTTITLARASDAQQYKDRIVAALATLGAADTQNVVIDETIVGGVVVQKDYTVLDQSYKTALTKLYHNITKAQ